MNALRVWRMFGIGVALAVLVLVAGNQGQVSAQTSSAWWWRGNGGTIYIDPFSPGNWPEVSLWFNSGGQSSRLVQCGSSSCDPNSGTGQALYIESNTPIYFTNMYARGSTSVAIWGNLNVTGTKTSSRHPRDPGKEIVYVSLEGPEADTYLRGTAELVNGQAVVELPQHFSLVTSDEGLTVQLTPRGEWLQLYTVQVSTTQIIVREAQGKNGKFDYLIQGVRKGFENHQVIQDKNP